MWRVQRAMDRLTTAPRGSSGLYSIESFRSLSGCRLSDVVLNYNQEFFGPVGRCIYCGSDTGKLTSEHIWPYFIGGNTELEGSSCHACQDTTSYLDGYCANNIFKSIRHHHQIQTRSRKSRPTHIPIIFDTKSGPETRDVPIAEWPYVLALPQFDLPGLLIGKPQSSEMIVKAYSIWTDADLAARIKRLMRPDDLGWHVKVGGKNDVFARWLAKTALAGAIGMLGYDPLKSPLRAVVRGTDTRLGWLIGSEPPKVSGVTYSEHPPTMGRDEHKIAFGYMSNGRNTLLVATLALFHKHGTPIQYPVIVGDAMPNPVETYIKAPSKRPQRRAGKNRAR
jgi:hypothetical protein